MSFFDVKGAQGRFDGVTRPYTEQDVQRLRGSVKVGWHALPCRSHVRGLGSPVVSSDCHALAAPCAACRVQCIAPPLQAF